MQAAGDYQLDLARFHLSQEIGMRELISDTNGLVDALSGLSWVLILSSQYDSALTTSERGLALAARFMGREDTVTARLEGLVGKAYGGLNKYKEAMEHLKASLLIRLAALGTKHRRVADAYYDLGVYEFQFAHFDDAIVELSSAASIYTEIDSLESARSWQWIAASWGAKGRLSMMDSAVLKSIDIARAAVGDSSPELIPFYGFAGQLYAGLGFEEKALGYRSNAMELAELSGSPWWLALSMSDLASTYFELGELEKADSLASRALEVFTEVFGEEGPRVWAYYSLLGEIRMKEGKTDDGLNLLSKAVENLRNLPEGSHPQILASTLDDLATGYREKGNYAEAVRNYDEALSVWEKCPVGTGFGVAETMDGLGATYLKAGNPGKALAYFEASVQINEKNYALAPLSLAKGYTHLSQAEKALGQDSVALIHASMAADVFEQSSLRVGTEYRKAYAEKHSEIYENYIDLLMASGRFEEAFEVVERSKLKRLKASLEEGSMALGEDSLKQKLNFANELSLEEGIIAEQLLAEKSKDTLEQAPERIASLSKILAETKAEFFKVVSEIKTEPDYAFAVTVDPVLFASLRQELPEGQKLLMAYPSEKKLYLFLVSDSNYEARSIDISRDSVSRLVAQCRYLCFDKGLRLIAYQNISLWNWNSPDSAFYERDVKPLKDVLTKLYDLLIEPFEASLENSRIVTFIPSSELYYIPFGALAYEKEGNLHFLSEKINWNLLTSAELLKCIQRRSDWPADKPDTLLVVGNPLGANLPESQIEAQAIDSEYPGSILLLGENATEPEVTDKSKNIKFLHIASHCRLNSTSPWESYIQLSSTAESDGRWTATEISGEEWRRMQLVTLSACETAIGSDKPGLEWESMAKAFSLAMEGPPSIVATLWPVADESTRDFMISFYGYLKTMSKSEALRRAQSDLIHSSKYSHPFFWAPFILIGEWR